MKSGSVGIAVDAARADLAHEIHAHAVAADGEKGAMAERENAAIAPDQIEREREHGIAQIFAEQRHEISRHIAELAGRRAEDCWPEQEWRAASRMPISHQALVSRARNRACVSMAWLRRGRRCSSKFSLFDRPSLEGKQAARAALDEEDDHDQDQDFAEHGAGIGFEEFVGDAQCQRATSVPQRLPTPPNTTTMKLSMM
jgi:hypothetical protein